MALVVGPLAELGGPVEGADAVAVVEEVAAPTAASGLLASALAAGPARLQRLLLSLYQTR